MDWNIEFLDPFSCAEAEQPGSVNILTSVCSTRLDHDYMRNNDSDPNNNNSSNNNSNNNNDDGGNLLPQSCSSLPENLCLRKSPETEGNRPQASVLMNESRLVTIDNTTFPAVNNLTNLNELSSPVVEPVESVVSVKLSGNRNPEQFTGNNSVGSDVSALSDGQHFQTKPSGKNIVGSRGTGSDDLHDSSASIEVKVSSESARIEVIDSRMSSCSSVKQQELSASSIPVILSGSVQRGKGAPREWHRSTDHCMATSAATSYCNTAVTVAPPSQGSRYPSKCAVGRFPPPFRMPLLADRNRMPYMPFLPPAIHHVAPVVSGTCAARPDYHQPYWRQILPVVQSPLVSGAVSQSTGLYPGPLHVQPPPVTMPYVYGGPFGGIPSSGPAALPVPPIHPYGVPCGVPPGVVIGSPPPSIPSSAAFPPCNPVEMVNNFHHTPQTVYWPTGPDAIPASGSVAVPNSAWLQTPPPPCSSLSSHAVGWPAVCNDYNKFPTAGVTPSIGYLPVASVTAPLAPCSAACASNFVAQSAPVGVGGFPAGTFPVTSSRSEPLHLSHYQYHNADDRTLHSSTNVSTSVEKIHAADFTRMSSVESNWPSSYPLILRDHLTTTAATKHLADRDSLGTNKELHNNVSSVPSNLTAPLNTVQDLSTFQLVRQAANSTSSVVPPTSVYPEPQTSISAPFVWPSDNRQRTAVSQTFSASVSTVKDGNFCNQTQPSSFQASTVQVAPSCSVASGNSQSVRPVANSEASHSRPIAVSLSPKVISDVATKLPETSAASKSRPPVATNQTLTVDARTNLNSLLLATALSGIASEGANLEPGNVAELLQKIFVAAKMPNVAAGMQLIVQSLTEPPSGAAGSGGIAADNDDAASPQPPPPPPAPRSVCTPATSFTVPIPPPLPSLAELTDGGKMELDGDLMAAEEKDRTVLMRRLKRRLCDFPFGSSQNHNVANFDISDQPDSDSDDMSDSEPIAGSDSRSSSQLSAGGDAGSRLSPSVAGSEAGASSLLSPSQNTSVTTTVSDSSVGTPLSESSDKTDRMNHVVEHVRLLLKPFYKRGDIDTQTYKEIMRKAVPKILENRSVSLKSRQIEKFVAAYVEKTIARHQQMNAAIATKSRTKKK